MKEPDNPYDSEAIRVTLKHVGTVGYMANSTYTTVTGTMSAGRIYEKVGKKFKAEVMFITPVGVICRVVPEEEKKQAEEIPGVRCSAPAEAEEQKAGLFVQSA